MPQRKKQYKKPFTEGRNIGLMHKRRYRALQLQVHFLLEAYRTEDGKINFSKEIYKELFDNVMNLPEIKELVDLDEQERSTKQAIEFTTYKLMLNGDLVIAQILGAEVLMTHKDIINEAREAGDFKAAISGSRDFLEMHHFVKGHRDDGAAQAALKLSQSKDGTKEMLAIGTGAECLHLIREALGIDKIKVLEGKKNAISK